MAVYKFREGHSVKGDAQAIGERLDQLMSKHGGAATPGQVLADAASKKSPLHASFEWDDTVAAKAHRLEQARYLVRSIEIVHVPFGNPGSREVEVIATRAFPHVVIGKSPVYATMGTVMADANLRLQLLDNAKRALATWRKNYTDLQELSAVYASVDAALLTEERAELVAS